MSISANSGLFPVPSPPSAKYVPSWTGANPESTATLLRVLKDNHTRWHIFFNDIGFHNHTAHRALALWALGSDGDVIQKAYDSDSTYQRPAIEPPKTITAANFNDHLGDRPYYGAYLTFFTDAIKQQGVKATIEEYIFSKKANFHPEHPKKSHPEMFGRLLGGLLHPMIHTGYGLEFGLPGMAAEGLAEAAVHASSEAAFFPDSFLAAGTASSISRVISPLKSLVLSDKSASGVHALTVLARVLKDPKLGDVVEREEKGMYAKVMGENKDLIAKYVNEWHIDTSTPEAVSRMVEEIFWVNALIYGVGGWSPVKDFNADFFHMHLVTSSLFLPSYMAYLTTTSQEMLLKGYLLASLGRWVSRGRPNICIKDFYEVTSAYPTPSGALPTPSESTFPSPSSPKAVTPNPWLPIIETTLVHPDDHLVKLQRALVHHAAFFGSQAAGRAEFKDSELPDAGMLDGSLFIRIAGLTAKRMGRVREGEASHSWDRDGFYKVKL